MQDSGLPHISKLWFGIAKDMRSVNTFIPTNSVFFVSIDFDRDLVIFSFLTQNTDVCLTLEDG